MENELSIIHEKLSDYKQEHLINFLNHITDEENRKNYLNQLKNIDYELMNSLFNTIVLKPKQIETNYEISPINSNFNSCDFSSDEYDDLYIQGLEKIYEGKIALLILAGGQGSRLGLNKPKGMYNIQMPSNKSLFEYLCNRFLSVQNLAKQRTKKETEFIPSTLLIMTSLENHDDTVNFFKENNYFNISSDNIVFFPQDTIPALDLNGKIINKEVDQIFLAPNGNGGCFISMKKNKIIHLCLDKKIEYINVISVDNPLSKTLDPLFIGLTYKHNFQMSAKTVPKTEANEAIGVFLNLNGKPVMMDYGDIPKNLTELRDEDGHLVYRGGNILNYLIGTKMLDEILLDEDKYKELISEFHLSKKKIPSVFIKDSTIIREPVNGVKFELFFNSIFKFCDEKGMLLMEVSREKEFAPVKNNIDSPTDNPITTKKKMTDLFSSWLKNSGVELGEVKQLEISFLLSYDGENLIPGRNVPEKINNSDVCFISN